MTFKLVIRLIFVCFLAESAVVDSTVLKTSFETSGALPYSVGTINGQRLWSVSSGAGNVVAESTYAYAGTNGLKVSSSNTTVQLTHTPYGPSAPGLGGVVYFDMYVKILSLATKEFTIVGYDLFGGSTKRTFVLEFSVPSGDSGEVRVYTSSSRPKYVTYKTKSWYRVTGKIDY